MHLISVLGLFSKKCSTESSLISSAPNRETIAFYIGLAF